MVKYDIKNIYQWPNGAKALLLISLSVLLFILGYVVDVVRFKTEITNSIKHEADLKGQLQLMMDRQFIVKSNITQLPMMKTRLIEWQKKIISKDELPDLLNKILKTAQSNNLKIVAFNPEGEIKDGIYYKTPVNIDMTGTYDQIATFISQLANFSKLVNIDAFTLTNSDKSLSDSLSLNSDAVLTAQLDIEIYRR